MPLTDKKFNLVLSMVACFVAVETGALVVCIGIMLFDAGPLAILEGIAIWAVSQPVTLFFALFFMPVGVLTRTILGLNFQQPRRVAVLSGAVFGLLGSALFTSYTKGGWLDWPPILIIGLVSGIAGGWAWWRVEKPFLDRKTAKRTS